MKVPIILVWSVYLSLANGRRSRGVYLPQLQAEHLPHPVWWLWGELNPQHEPGMVIWLTPTWISEWLGAFGFSNSSETWRWSSQGSTWILAARSIPPTGRLLGRSTDIPRIPMAANMPMAPGTLPGSYRTLHPPRRRRREGRGRRRRRTGMLPTSC